MCSVEPSERSGHIRRSISDTADELSRMLPEEQKAVVEVGDYRGE